MPSTTLRDESYEPNSQRKLLTNPKTELKNIYEPEKIWKNT